MRILLDTNVLVAALATRGICQDVFRVVLAEHRLLVGETVLGEHERILKDKLRTPARRVREIAAFMREHGELIAPAAPAPWPENDPDDRWVIAAAMEGSADVLVTGDNDILKSGHAADFRIVTPRGFWESLRDHPARLPSN